MIARFQHPRYPGRSAEHGTRTAYAYGCRCDPCREEEAAYQSWWWRERGQELYQGPLGETRAART